MNDFLENGSAKKKKIIDFFTVKNFLFQHGCKWRREGEGGADMLADPFS